MSKSGKAKAKIPEIVLEPIIEELVPAEPRFLTEDALHLWKIWDKKKSPRDFVPSHTPNSEYDFGNGFQTLPRPFPDVNNLKVPYIRDTGVKFCIEVLGEYFGCQDYKYNMLQFWFLDVLTDCLWTAQDDFRLTVDQQKIVLTWVLYLIDLLRDPQQNMSRKKFFTVFKEAMLVAAEVVDEGCATVPMPEKLFSLIQQEEELESWKSIDSQSSSSSLEITADDLDNISCIEIEMNEKRRRFQLPQETCKCDKYDLSSVNSIPESDSLSKKSSKEYKTQELGTEEAVQEELSTVAFYQPDLNIPSRFLLHEEDEVTGEEAEEATQIILDKPMCKIEDEADVNQDGTSVVYIVKPNQDQYNVIEVSDQFAINRTSEISLEKNENLDSSTTETNTNDKKPDSNWTVLESEAKSPKQERLLEQYNDKEIVKGIAHQKLWDQRIKDMDNPRKGWISTPDKIFNVEEVEGKDENVEDETSEEQDAPDDEDWADIVMERQKEQVRKEEDTLVVNFGVLRAIIDFVFKYFYESFQFLLIKLAFQATPEIITQKVNQEWKIPKRIKVELQKPKVEVPKKKKEKDKKSKSDKSSKKDKKSKDKKSSKKSDKKSKSGKGSKKDKKKDKKTKPAKLTKEEKEELERKKREQARIEEELRKLEENKRFMFPLTDAATDELFHSIFENWVKIDLTKGKGKGKGKGKDKGKGKKKKK